MPTLAIVQELLIVKIAPRLMPTKCIENCDAVNLLFGIVSPNFEISFLFFDFGKNYRRRVWESKNQQTVA